MMIVVAELRPTEHLADKPAVVSGLGRAGLHRGRGRDIDLDRLHRRTRRRVGRLAPDDALVSNYAFDVTPNDLVTAIITEKGVARAPYTESLKKQFSEVNE